MARRHVAEVRPSASYIICATQRSGSTLLCDALQATGVAGRPDEYLDPGNIRELSGRWGTADAISHLNAVLRNRTSPNGVFGLKVMYPDLKDFVETIWGPVERPGELASRVGELLPNPRYLFITRRDKIRQAVSYWRALQTEQWSSLEPQPAVFQGSYQFERISSLRAYIAQCERAWQGYFNDSRITPYLVVYEDFVVSYRETTAGVLAYLGLAATRSPLEPRMKRQADSLSEAWAERFQREEAERRSLMNSGVLGGYPDGEC